jgi:hypothetical protein
MSSSETPKTNPKFIAPEKDAPLLTTFSSLHIKVFAGIAILLVLALGYKLFSKPSIKLISPSNKQELGADLLDFQWQSNKSEVSYVLEVYEQETSNLVMRQITDQQGYKPDRYQQSFFQADKDYYWLIMSNPDMEQSYNFRSESRYFKINKTVEPPADPSTIPPDQQQPIEQQNEQQNNQKQPEVRQTLTDPN